jgi:putative DNA methylase
LQERLYCIQWISYETLDKTRQTTFFAGVTEADLGRERKVEKLVADDLENWQRDGLVPDMEIEPGDKTDDPIRTRGWTYLHHLFPPRHLLLNAFCERHLRHLNAGTSVGIAISLCRSLDAESKLTRWRSLTRTPGTTGGLSEKIENVFYNQALNCFYNYGVRSGKNILSSFFGGYPHEQINGSPNIACHDAAHVASVVDIWLTDPPYADAIRYEEITEYFIAWLRKNPPTSFTNWVWDSRRPLAIKGTGEEFRRDMTTAYGAMARNMPDNGLQIVMFTHQDASVWADMAAIVWGAGLQVTAAWYIATETTSELKKGGYVQGTVLLVLRKRAEGESVYRDELVQEVRSEVARQIETMTGLNQSTKGAGRSENLFEDADLQMAGYAAALRVLTGYSRIDGQDMGAEALRPRQKGGRDLVKEIIDFAVQVANEHLVPEGIPATLWERLSGPERFYVKMLDIEAAGLRKIDNYQNFAKAFRYGDYNIVMASTKANDARLKTALELKRTEFESEFGKSPLRAVLFALFELQIEVDIDEVTSHLRDLIPGYLTKREDLMALAAVIAAKRENKFPPEAQAARILLSRIRNERLG